MVIVSLLAFIKCIQHCNRPVVDCCVPMMHAFAPTHPPTHTHTPAHTHELRPSPATLEFVGLWGAADSPEGHGGEDSG